MSNSLSERVNTAEANDETCSLIRHELTDVSSAGSSWGIPVTSEEVAPLIRETTDPLTKQSELLCKLMRETSG